MKHSTRYVLEFVYSIGTVSFGANGPQLLRSFVLLTAHSTDKVKVFLDDVFFRELLT